MRTLVLGFDAFDPVIFETLYEQGLLPNLGGFVNSGGYARFAVANPPQSEVSWTSIATGLNPGGHGMFDFVHRDPKTYALSVSLLPTQSGMLGTRFVRPHTARTIFDHAVDQGYPATSLWWPATFPADPGSPVRTLPGLGTPDILGRLGVGTRFSTDPDLAAEDGKTRGTVLQRYGQGRYHGTIEGPIRKTLRGTQTSKLDFTLEVADADSARLTIGEQRIDLQRGAWSPILHLSFDLGLFLSVNAITRVILTRTGADVVLYMLPLQQHPLHTPWDYGSPSGFVKDSWHECGPFLTLGWPQDTTALEEGCISDEQFLDLCDSIAEARERVLMHHLKDFDEGVLACVFDTLDRIQHMFWREQPDVVKNWYVKLDAFVGRVEKYLARNGSAPPHVVIVSDHGFTDFNYKVHLNRWLIDRGYLVARATGPDGSLSTAEWSRTRAYALGLNGLYVNLTGREGRGIVKQAEYDATVEQLRQALTQWRGPDNRRVVQEVWRQRDAFTGPLARYGPDLVVGFSPGYRASSETGLGQWKPEAIVGNGDHWQGDHCVAATAVPGVIFATSGLDNLHNPAYGDFPALAVGAAPDGRGAAPRPYARVEDQQAVEDRLRDLGYF